MDLSEIVASPTESLGYLERYVNDGSPSGFTALHRTSEATDPYGAGATFHLLAASCADMYVDYPPNVLASQVPADVFFIHPDMGAHPDLRGFDITRWDGWEVTPTASARTVRICAPVHGDYLKLHYDGVIGRINRRLPWRKAVNGPEVSAEILAALDRGTLPTQLAIFHEPLARTLSNIALADKAEHWSFIWREATPRGRHAGLIEYLVPLFALWSRDRLSDGPTLLAQLVARWGAASSSVLLCEVMLPILDIYFGLLTTLGFQDELNAQNIVVGFSREWRPVALVLRDFMGVEKDIDLRQSLGLATDFTASSYKVIGKYIDGTKCSIRHSFAFDFKLTHYVLKPLVVAGIRLGLWTWDDAIRQLRHHVGQAIRALPGDFFPSGNVWYAHRKELLVKEKVFISLQNPLLR